MITEFIYSFCEGITELLFDYISQVLLFAWCELCCIYMYCLNYDVKMVHVCNSCQWLINFVTISICLSTLALLVFLLMVNMWILCLYLHFLFELCHIEFSIIRIQYRAICKGKRAHARAVFGLSKIIDIRSSCVFICSKHMHVFGSNLEWHPLDLVFVGHI